MASQRNQWTLENQNSNGKLKCFKLRRYSWVLKPGLFFTKFIYPKFHHFSLTPPLPTLQATTMPCFCGSLLLLFASTLAPRLPISHKTFFSLPQNLKMPVHTTVKSGPRLLLWIIFVHVSVLLNLMYPPLSSSTHVYMHNHTWCTTRFSPFMQVSARGFLAPYLESILFCPHSTSFSALSSLIWLYFITYRNLIYYWFSASQQLHQCNQGFCLFCSLLYIYCVAHYRCWVCLYWIFFFFT